MQVDPIRPTLRAPGTKRSKLKCADLHSSFAFELNLRRYILEAKERAIDSLRETLSATRRSLEHRITKAEDILCMAAAPPATAMHPCATPMAAPMALPMTPLWHPYATPYDNPMPPQVDPILTPG